MKFPRKLSKERLSLLSPEDRKIYEYEHSGLCPEMKQLQESKKKKRIYNDEGNIVPNICPKCGGKVVLKIKGEPVYVCSNCDAYYGTMPFNLKESEDVIDNSDDEITYEDIQDIKLSNEYSEEEKRQIKQMMDEMLFESQFDELFDKELIAEVGLDEYNNIKKNIFEYIMNDPDLHTLNEAEGHAADWWMDCSWILKLSAGLLTGLLGIIAWLFMKGKDRLAMMKLKQYMNKLVELTDSGVNKKRPWYSFLLPGRKNKQNTGDYNKACFRTIQETAERNMACLYTQCIHRLGFLSPSLTNFNNITSGGMPPEDSGLGNFINLASIMSVDVENIKLPEDDISDENVGKLLPFKLNKDYLNTINLPALPTNYAMLMSNIDYPTKANENPNGSLFMKPTKEILQDKGSDLGITYFNKNIKLNSIINVQSNKNESYISSLNSYLNAIFEVENEEGLDKTKGVSLGGLLTGDTNPTTVLGSDIDQETKKREETKAHSFNGNFIDAIDNYVRASVPIITKLIKSICGTDAIKDMQELSKTLSVLNNAAEGNMSKYMKHNDKVLHDIMDNDNLKTIQEQRDTKEVLQMVIKLFGILKDDKIRQSLQISDEQYAKGIDEIDNNTNGLDYKKRDFENDVERMFHKSFKEILQIWKEQDKKKKNAEVQSEPNVNASYSYINDYLIAHSLYEDEQFKDKEDIQKEIIRTIERTYKDTKNSVTDCMMPFMTIDTQNWYIIKNAGDRMKKLKEAADKEITEKIGLICRTSQSATSTLGDKFKAALSKHPVRAASLQNIWARYADDLDDRIESRLRSISGDNGNSNIMDSIKTFLSTTYPNLIALMLYYKSIFYLVKLYTDKFPIDKNSVELYTKEKEDNDKLRLNILMLHAQAHDDINNTKIS